LDQRRGTPRSRPYRADQDKALVDAIKRLRRLHPRYGYRRITALLRAEGGSVNRKRVYRLWRQEGLKVPGKKGQRKRLGDWSGALSGPAVSRPQGPSAVARRRSIVLNRDASAQDHAPGYSDQRCRISVAQSASNRVMEHLYQLRQMRPLSIWWIILTLTALALLLGPVDYLVLKRLDKLPYTWLTNTGWILIFTVGAYYGVQWIRGGAMELRTVSVTDGVADSNCTWATCYAGLFAPRRPSSCSPCCRRFGRSRTWASTWR
jgi:hypothetical protein